MRSHKWSKRKEEPIRERDSDMYIRRCRIRYASRSNQFLKCVISVSCHEPHTKETRGKPAAYQQRHCHTIASLHGASPTETPIWCGALLQGAQTWLPSLTVHEMNSAEKSASSCGATGMLSAMENWKQRRGGGGGRSGRWNAKKRGPSG